MQNDCAMSSGCCQLNWRTCSLSFAQACASCFGLHHHALHLHDTRCRRHCGSRCCCHANCTLAIRCEGEPFCPKGMDQAESIAWWKDHRITDWTETEPL